MTHEPKEREQAVTPAVLADNPCDGARANLAELGHMLSNRAANADVEGLLSRLSDSVDRLVIEHEGMADELLAV